MDRRTLTMNWDGLLGEDDDEEQFFESRSRMSVATLQDLASSGSDDDDEFDDPRMSFTSAISSSSAKSFNGFDPNAAAAPLLMKDYNVWMAAPGSITERRKRLLQGMGISSNKDLLKLASAKILGAAASRKIETIDRVPSSKDVRSPATPPEWKQGTSPVAAPVSLVRSRSDGELGSFSVFTKQRKQELIGNVSKQRLTRTSSLLSTPHVGVSQYANFMRLSPNSDKNKKPNSSNNSSFSFSDGAGVGTFFLIKNLDTGKEFIVKEFSKEGMWDKLSDLQTGKQLTMEEFERTLGHSPVVKGLMRRANVGRETLEEDVRKGHTNSYLSRSFRYSKKRGVAFLKNIRGVATTVSGLMVEKDQREHNSPTLDQQSSKNNTSSSSSSSSQWVKVRQQGKSYKEFTAMHMCQEIKAHEGSIWTIKFSLDGRYLASAGEDTLIHVWEVQDCDVMSMRLPEELNSASTTPIHPMASEELRPMPFERRKKGKTSNRKKTSSIPHYVQVPETAFALSEKPLCTFQGHQDDVLDLSWSRSQLLLSSSMDKTVRLWDMESKSCLKLFTHNDYVTCTQFNPIDDDYFISGSLDAKVRIWNIPRRQVVDWIDVHEMVTAASYTPDGQGALIGSHKGSCCFYNLADCKIEKEDHIDFQNKRKSHGRKITGFEFAPAYPFEVLITSADSRIRIFDGSDIIQKFRGFRNTNSQISASYSPDGNYIISASEDSHVYIWRREDAHHVGNGKTKSLITTHSHEHFQCKEVSVAVPWPGSARYDSPIVQIQSKRHTKRTILQHQHNHDSLMREDNNLGSVANSRRYLPPLHKRSNLETTGSSLDEDLLHSPPKDPGIGASESFFMDPSSIRYGDSPSISASGSSPSQTWGSSRSVLDGSNSHHGNNTIQAAAWGLVIVTAGLGGEIRVYQNFGLPLKVGRQTNLF